MYIKDTIIIIIIIIISIVIIIIITIIIFILGQGTLFLTEYKIGLEFYLIILTCIPRLLQSAYLWKRLEKAVESLALTFFRFVWNRIFLKEHNN